MFEVHKENTEYPSATAPQRVLNRDDLLTTVAKLAATLQMNERIIIERKGPLDVVLDDTIPEGAAFLEHPNGQRDVLIPPPPKPKVV